ncbi:MAG: ATP-dependent helicase [Segetibacter sp.]|nr:ATP-dependent helicase [Segetibacter sp.]
MQLTTEQYDIIHSTGNIKINAVAGSGKTTTIIEYAKARPANSKILYLAFNKTVKLEAKKKFAEKGMHNAQVETAHSLAYKHIVMGSHYKVRSQEYKSYEIAELLGIQGSGEKHAEYIIANHVQKFIAYFCNSDKGRVQELNYLDVVTEPKAKTFVNTFYPYIITQARRLLGMMDKGEVEINDDFYLKKFQLSNPKLYYDYILFDEGQDASPAMLDVFLRQLATKVIVGDAHQQIYGWRYAVNSLEQVNFPTYHLSTSFRFPQSIADLAKEVLEWKHHLGEHKTVVINGQGHPAESKSKAVIARTNLGLLLKAIAYVTERKSLDKIYFEGNIYSYTYADEGASLYDVLNLYNGKRGLIKDKLIQSMNHIAELKDYIEKTEDAQLGMMVEIVEEYGNEIPGIIKSLKDKHIGDEDRDKADIVFSTVHRCKGMEYDEIQVVNDFLTEEKIEKQVAEKGIKHKLNEEINLLYVAVTRARQKVNIPADLLPKEFPPSPNIRVLNAVKLEEDAPAPASQPYQKYSKEKSNSGKQKAKIIPMNALKQAAIEGYRPWTIDEDIELTDMFAAGSSVFEIAKFLDRSIGAIRSRIRKLGLNE